MKLPASDIADIIGAVVAGVADTGAVIDTLLTDSRDLTYPDSTLFWALRTDSNDGHNYIADLYRAGVRHFVVDRDVDPAVCPDAMLMHVPDVLAALQELGARVRAMFPDLLVIGITGSRGKTVVKEQLYRMLVPHYRVIRSPRSYNSQIGVPLSLWQIDADTRIAIIEAGISLPGEMDRLHRMIRPDIAVVTSLTDEHSRGFDSLLHKLDQKCLLTRGCHRVYTSADCDNADMIMARVRAAAPDTTIIETAGGNRGLSRDIAHDVDRQLSGGANAGAIDDAALSDNIRSRIEVIATLKNCLVVFDSFTNDYRSIYDALNYTRRHLTPGRSLTVILTEPYPAVGCGRLAALLVAKGVSRVIAVGCALAGLDVPGADTVTVPSVGEFMRRYTISDFENEVILVKGIPGSGAEDIKTLLEAPRHQTVLEVDLGAITRNFNFFKSRIHPRTGIVAMVKADGYGMGAIELSKTMQSQGARYLAVAVVDEGADLRRNGITMPIIVMNPIGTNYKALFQNSLEPSVFSLRELRLLMDNAARLGIRDYPVHVKLDTGMHRLGFLDDELDALIDVIVAQDTVRVQSIFSHLATADCLDQDAYTQMQLDAFERMSGRIMRALPYRPLRHILNTAGILRYPAYQYDMVRLGIGLYGVAPIDGYRLDTVAQLMSTIISIKRYDTPVTVGYGRHGVVDCPMTIATVPIGYADGLNRHLSNHNAYMVVNGHRCDIIGNICMDQCMIDVTDADAHIGDTVLIFGKDAPVQRLASTLRTIPYEVFTSVSPRVKRIYFRE